MTASEDGGDSAKRLQGFLNECLALGCLKGFRYFEVSLRGREELILRIIKPRPPTSSGSSGSASSSGHSVTADPENGRVLRYAYTSSSIEVARESATLASTRTKTLLGQSGERAGLINDVWPSTDVDLQDDQHYTTFLIAAYARYKCPYVWLKSTGKDETIDPDAETYQAPLKLESTGRWHSQDINLWEIVAELVQRTLGELRHINPLAVNHALLETLPIEESIVLSGAMSEFLTQVIFKDTSLLSQVRDDIRRLEKQHFAAFHEILDEEVTSKVPSERSTPISSLSDYLS